MSIITMSSNSKNTTIYFTNKQKVLTGAPKSTSQSHSSFKIHI